MARRAHYGSHHRFGVRSLDRGRLLQESGLPLGLFGRAKQAPIRDIPCQGDELHGKQRAERDAIGSWVVAAVGRHRKKVDDRPDRVLDDEGG